jgi:interferon, gamma-inducible protein 30
MLRQALLAGLVLTSIAILGYYHHDNAQHNLQKVTADGKVKVDFYTESLCPDCLAFTSTSLKKAVATPDFWKICEFNIFPYGNARRQQNGSNWAFTCQHGAKECLGNTIQACGIRKYDYYSKGLPFALCLEDNTTDFVAQGQRCATKFGLNWA